MTNSSALLYNDYTVRCALRLNGSVSDGINYIRMYHLYKLYSKLLATLLHNTYFPTIFYYHIQY